MIFLHFIYITYLCYDVMVRPYCKHPDGRGRVIEDLIDISSSMVQVVVRPRPFRNGGMFDSKPTKPILDHALFAREVKYRPTSMALFWL